MGSDFCDFLEEKKKPEDSKTVHQWGLLGRIPKDGAEPNYLWTVSDFYQNEVVTTVYYLEVDTRPMTEQEKEMFFVDRKGFAKRYADFFTEEMRKKERRRREELMEKRRQEKEDGENNK